jgi:hypothetical protein
MKTFSSSFRCCCRGKCGVRFWNSNLAFRFIPPLASVEKLVRGLRPEEQVRNRPQDNSDLQRRVPVLQILKIARDSILNVGITSRCTAKTAPEPAR